MQQRNAPMTFVNLGCFDHMFEDLVLETVAFQSTIVSFTVHGTRACGALGVNARGDDATQAEARIHIEAYPHERSLRAGDCGF